MPAAQRELTEVIAAVAVEPVVIEALLEKMVALVLVVRDALAAVELVVGVTLVRTCPAIRGVAADLLIILQQHLVGNSQARMVDPAVDPAR